MYDYISLNKQVLRVNLDTVTGIKLSEERDWAGEVRLPTGHPVLTIHRTPWYAPRIVVHYEDGVLAREDFECLRDKLVDHMAGK